MKKIVTVIALVLALNFLAVAGGVGWLVASHKLDREKALVIRDVLFPKPEVPKPATQPVADATTQPTLKLEELLAQKTGRNAAEQVDFIQQTFDGQQATLERRQRELLDLQRRVDLARDQLARDRAKLTDRQKTFDARAAETDKLLSDEGFQNSLTLYNTMPAKQVKSVFIGLDDDTVVRYLQAMQPRTAAKIIKEFKLPEELARVQRVMEKMRQAKATADANAADATNNTAPGGN